MSEQTRRGGWHVYPSVYLVRLWMDGMDGWTFALYCSYRNVYFPLVTIQILCTYNRIRMCVASITHVGKIKGIYLERSCNMFWRCG